MKEREIYSINSDHGIIIIINDKQYLYMFNTITTSLTEKNSEVIIEKETGLFLKSNAPEDTVEREYTFNNIEDSIFAEPDISQYKIKEK